MGRSDSAKKTFWLNRGSDTSSSQSWHFALEQLSSKHPEALLSSPDAMT
jgi:hypothetical protein